jgi:hypothetical protein
MCVLRYSCCEKHKDSFINKEFTGLGCKAENLLKSATTTQLPECFATTNVTGTFVFQSLKTKCITSPMPQWPAGHDWIGMGMSYDGSGCREPMPSYTGFVDNHCLKFTTSMSQKYNFPFQTIYPSSGNCSSSYKFTVNVSRPCFHLDLVSVSYRLYHGVGESDDDGKQIRDVPIENHNCFLLFA